MKPSEKVRSAVQRKTLVSDKADYIIRLRKGVISPMDVGKQLAPTTFVVSKEEVDGFQDVMESVFIDRSIQFQLDMPGGADVTENTDNWGIGPLGLAASSIWAMGFKGGGVRIGIADSGLDASLPTFASLIAEKRLIGFAAFNADGSKDAEHRPDGSLVPDMLATPTSSHWHGTFCAASIVGESDGRMRGVAPSASLAVVRALQRGNVGTVSSISAGLLWLNSQKLEIVSLSLGWPGKHEEWASAIQTALDAGVVVVAAVGNEWGVPGEGASRSPANYPFTPGTSAVGILISVGAHDQAGRLGDFSSGEIVDWSGVTVNNPNGTTRPSMFSTAPSHAVPTLIAPGVGIVEPIAANKYESQSGTSMATPQIAGLLALILSALRSKRPDATAREAADLLLSCLTPLPPPANPTDARNGQGRVDPIRLSATLTARIA